MKGRLTRLERMSGDGRNVCPECGHSPHAPARFELLDYGQEADRPDHCPECGRLWVFTLTLDRPGGDSDEA